MEGRQYNYRMDLLILYHMETEDAYMHYILYWQYIVNISLVFYLSVNVKEWLVGGGARPNRDVAQCIRVNLRIPVFSLYSQESNHSNTQNPLLCTANHSSLDTF
jgi:hypothetical protein